MESLKDLLIWAVGAMVTFINAAFWFWLNRLTSQLDAIKAELHSKGLAISSLESYVEGNEKRLDRIEQKIDRLLERFAGQR